jgi:hypothetical protein
MYTHIYIYIYISAHQAIRLFTYKKYMYPQANDTKTGSPAYQKGIHHTSIRVPLSHPHLLLPREEVVAHHHLPQAVVVEHPQDPPAPAAGIH